MLHSLLECVPETLYLNSRRHYFRYRRPQRFRALQDLRRQADLADYSLLPFDRTRAIFVHIPKCAGIAVNKALFDGLGGGHLTFDQYLQIFSAREIRDYFKFSIVRNPWDRLVSAFHFLQQGGLSAEDRAWAARELAPYRDFKAFVQGWLTPERASSWYHFRPQWEFLCDRYGKIQLDFIGYLENLDADFAYIARRLGKDVSLGKSNQSQRDDYRQYYDAETRAIVARIYAKDIELLGYDFDNSHLKDLIAHPRQVLGA